jgi:hypothetical protein
VYNAVKGHVVYIENRRVLCTALRHIMSTSMPLCKGPFIIPFPKKTCSIPMSTSDFSYMYYVEKRIYVSVGHKTFFEIIGEIRLDIGMEQVFFGNSVWN